MMLWYSTLIEPPGLFRWVCTMLIGALIESLEPLYLNLDVIDHYDIESYESLLVEVSFT